MGGLWRMSFEGFAVLPQVLFPFLLFPPMMFPKQPVQSSPVQSSPHNPSIDPIKPLQRNILDPLSQAVSAPIGVTPSFDRAFFQRFYNRKQRHPACKQQETPEKSQQNQVSLYTTEAACNMLKCYICCRIVSRVAQPGECISCAPSAASLEVATRQRRESSSC